MKRTVIQFNVTASEKRKIQRAAKQCRMSMSAWLKLKALAGNVAEKP